MMKKRDKIINKIADYEIDEYFIDMYEWYYDDEDHLIGNSPQRYNYNYNHYLDEWFYDVDYKFLPDSKIIDMDSIYPKSLIRQRKIDSLLNYETKYDFRNTISNIIKNKNESRDI